jgi:hypothetical protein
MAALVAAIHVLDHVLEPQRQEDVDTRDKPRYDG